MKVTDILNLGFYMISIFTFSVTEYLIILLIIVTSVAAYISGKLTLSASAMGAVVALLIYLGAGWSSLIMLAVFFILGTAATSFKKEYKIKMQLAEVNEGRRKLSQVLANGGVAAILAALCFVVEPLKPVFLVMIAGSLASATGDTLSSELGNVFGRNFYNILTLRKDEKGLNGVISLEGTLFGIVGSMLIAFVYAVEHGWSVAFIVITISGTIGNLCDSLLGALYERKGYLGNDTVNFLSTAIAALAALILLQ